MAPICRCNRFTAEDFGDAARRGARTVEGAIKRLGGSPECGRCMMKAREAMDAARQRAEEAE